MYSFSSVSMNRDFVSLCLQREQFQMEDRMWRESMEGRQVKKKKEEKSELAGAG